MSVREKINRVKIEGWRVSRIPIAADQVVYQGDLMVWNAASKVAVPATSSTSGALFIGMADTSNPIETVGSSTFLSDSQTPRINVIQQGLVEVIWGTAETIYPFDEVVLSSAGPQHAVKGASNPIGIVDPSYGAAGRATVSGELIKIWLRVPNAYRCHY
jgi:hypothetical protein